MERRLIDANALKEAFEEDWHLTEYIEELIDGCPIIDAVEVVRCKECKHRGDPILCRMIVFDSKTHQLSDWTRDNGFCDFGMRREPDGE